jgi:hypothetical protein
MNTEKRSNAIITLLDGRTLPCYPKQKPTAPIDNSMKLDTTGQYLTIGRRHRRPRVQEPSPEILRAEKFFSDHAFFFLKHHEQILGDSRMFLAPVTVQNGLAYTGTSGFQCPTLGVYLQWWLTYPQSSVGKSWEDGWLVYRISGSPLTGANCCGIVNHKGECKERNIQPFRELCQSFVEINTRYDKAKELYEVYSLEEVVKRLIVS